MNTQIEYARILHQLVENPPRLPTYTQEGRQAWNEWLSSCAEIEEALLILKEEEL